MDKIQLWYCPINDALFTMMGSLYMVNENPLDAFFASHDPLRHFPSAILLDGDFKLGTDYGDDE